MSSIVTSILSLTVGLLWNTGRDWIAPKLKDGDVTDAKIREIVVRELNVIQTKLDGLSRANLLSSCSYLQEGVSFLNDCVSLDAATDPTQDDCGEPSRMPSGAESKILNEALEHSQAMKKLKINSDRKFESAKKRFEEARKKATEAFCNEALSIKDRILAARLRIVSEILECLESPDIAITGCLLSLKKLHTLSAIQEIFTVYLKKGVKAMFNKSERVENVKSVMLINYVLFHYVSQFRHSKYSVVLTWPKIDLAHRSFRPILDWQEVSSRKSMGDELTQHPSGLILDEKIHPGCSAVNSHGEVVVGEYPDNIKVISKKTGESKVVKLPEPSEGKVIGQYIVGLAVDNDNNVYVVRRLETYTENGDVKSFVLHVLDENYNVKQESRTLEFLGAANDHNVRIAINKNNNIIMIKDDDPHVYVCENTGNLKHKFERDSHLRSLGISGMDEIMMPSDDRQAVQIYSEEGDLKSTIKLPEGHEVRGLAFHYVICKIIVLTYVKKKNSYFLLCYTEAGVMETSTFFCKNIISGLIPDIKSHPSGPVAVVRRYNITFI